ncbi:MAG TPA: hypothetical protein DCL21_03900 [Alphaproteobacteria bacterium]|nr:hypothetical protein [Alphaproteobacteria bacterium]
MKFKVCVLLSCLLSVNANAGITQAGDVRAYSSNIGGISQDSYSTRPSYGRRSSLFEKELAEKQKEKDRADFYTSIQCSLYYVVLQDGEPSEAKIAEYKSLKERFSKYISYFFHVENVDKFMAEVFMNRQAKEIEKKINNARNEGRSGIVRNDYDRTCKQALKTFKTKYKVDEAMFANGKTINFDVSVSKNNKGIERSSYESSNDSSKITKGLFKCFYNNIAFKETYPGSKMDKTYRLLEQADNLYRETLQRMHGFYKLTKQEKLKVKRDNVDFQKKLKDADPSVYEEEFEKNYKHCNKVLVDTTSYLKMLQQKAK